MVGIHSQKSRGEGDEVLSSYKVGRGMSVKSVKIISKHSLRWAAVGSDVEAQRLANVIPLRADLSDP